MANVVIEAANSSQDCLVDAVWHAHVTLELRIGGLAHNSEDQGVLGGHILPDGLEFIEVRVPFNVHSNLLSEGCIVGIQQFELDYSMVTPWLRFLSASRMLLARELALFSPYHWLLPSNPCHRIVQPPFCMPMLSKFRKSSFLANPLMLMILSPTRTMYSRAEGLTGMTPLFLRRTNDSWTAVRLSWYSVVRCTLSSSATTPSAERPEVTTLAAPSASFTDNILATASLTLSMERVPFLMASFMPTITSLMALVPLHPGIMNISIPAFIMVVTESQVPFMMLKLVGSCWSMILCISSQSLITNPSKLSLSLRREPMEGLIAFGSQLMELQLTITLPISAEMAPLYPAVLCLMKDLQELTMELPSSAPKRVAPSPQKCFTEPRIPVLLPEVPCNPSVYRLAYWQMQSSSCPRVSQNLPHCGL